MGPCSEAILTLVSEIGLDAHSDWAGSLSFPGILHQSEGHSSRRHGGGGMCVAGGGLLLSV